MRTVTIQCERDRKPRNTLDEQIKYILGVAIRGNRKTTQGWVCRKIDKFEDREREGWFARATLHLEKTRGHKGGDAEEKQWDGLVEMIAKAGQHSAFKAGNWIIVDEDTPFENAALTQLPEDDAGTEEDSKEKESTTGKVKKTAKLAPGVHTILVPDRVLNFDDLRQMFPTELLEDETGEKIDNHPAFKGIYGRSPYIRILLSSIWSFIVSKGEKISHPLLYGKPACAKTKILSGIICELFGPGSYLKLDSTNTTRPGLEKMIFKELEEVPPFIIMEEIEKADEGTLAMWLGAMDDRHEFRKVNFHNVLVREVRFMGLGTANDKDKFDKMMGGKEGKPGALSSRFSLQLECPRPSSSEMIMILKRELPKIEGSEEWIGPAMELATLVGTDDPREIISFLDGGKRLMTGAYQGDILLAHGRTEKIQEIGTNWEVEYYEQTQQKQS